MKDSLENKSPQQDLPGCGGGWKSKGTGGAMQLLHLHSRASRGAAVPLSVLQDACPAPSPSSLETSPLQPAQSQGDAQREFGGVPDRAGFDAFTTLVQHPRAARKALCPQRQRTALLLAILCWHQPLFLP